MWPKAFAQFIELAPHISRLLPMADRFFQSKNAGDEAQQKAIAAMASGVRSDLQQIGAANAALHEQLLAAGDRAAAEAHAARTSVDALEARFGRIESRMDSISGYFTILLVLLVAIVVLLVVILVRGH